MRTFVVDSFTDVPFHGNPAGVCLVQEFPTRDQMQRIAVEMRHSETAFVRQTGKPGHIDIRFFSPVKEIPICGHATLAAACVLREVHGWQEVHATTHSGVVLPVVRRDDCFEMKFPLYSTTPHQAPPALVAALGLTDVVEASINDELNILILQIAAPALLAGLAPDPRAVEASHRGINGVVVTAAGDGTRKVSGDTIDVHVRYFWPWSGGAEDPVTGGIQTFLAGYWASRLGRNTLHVAQDSERGGTMTVTVDDDSVQIRGQAVLVLDGELRVDSRSSRASREPRPSAAAFDPAELERGLNGAASMIRTFYDGLDERAVSPATPIEDVIDMVRGSLGEDGTGIDAVLREVQTKLIPESMAIPHPLYLGLINSSPLPGGIIAESLIGALNNNAGAWEQSPAFSAAEHEVVRCLTELLGLPEATDGIVLPGGSFATLHGLQLAREHQLPQWRNEGIRSLSGNPRIYTSDATHFSAARAASVLGIAPRDAIAIPSTGRGSMNVAALTDAIRADRADGHLPFAVVATVGTTGTGASDSLPEIANVCREHGVWLHADVCYGGAAALLDECRDMFEGIDQVDSVAIDPHKWFFVPLVAGVLLTRHRGLGEDVFDIDASYIPTGSRVDAFRRGFPTSRRSAGFAIWMAIRTHGLAFIRNAVRQNNMLMRRMEDKLRVSGFRVMDGGRLSIGCARWESPANTPAENDALQSQIADAIVESGDAWFGTVRAQGQLWLRFALVSMHTREHHIDHCARRLTHVARSLTTA